MFHSIETGKNSPVGVPPQRVGLKEKKTIEENVKEMLDMNVIQPSKSPWAAPVVLVSKKDGSILH